MINIEIVLIIPETLRFEPQKKIKKIKKTVKEKKD